MPHNWFDYPEQKTDKKVNPSAHTVRSVAVYFMTKRF